MNICLSHRLFSVIVLFFCLGTSLQAQLMGKVTDENGESLSFATVYVKNTTIGTTTNIDGDYNLQLDAGNYEVVFQYVGYEQKIEIVQVTTSAKVLDVVLKEESVGLSEVVVSANAEDPAYAIIRKAMEKRKFHLNQVPEYACDAYTKGNQRVANVPEKILGMEVGDMGGVLDTTGSGIVYLSESVSKLYHQAPNQYKEEMISSKVSGDDNGFSFNQAGALDFNFYRNVYDGLGREIVSPIANNAFTFYKYRLEGAFVEESGQMVNKIRVIRKRDTDPSFEGYIYINEDLWNIHSIDMQTNGKAFAVDVLDSIYIKQVNVPVEGSVVWKPFSTNVSFKLKIFGIGFDGLFTAVYTNYNLNPGLGKKFFDSEILKVEEGANEKDSTYWETIRPIPLTQEEVDDYQKKDSLQVVWESKEFLDSMDRVSNKFKVLDILFGYTYSNSWKRWSMSFQAPLNAVYYNTVQGFHPNLNMSFRKDFDKDGYRNMRVGGRLVYGFSDKQVRGNFRADYRLNAVNFTRFGVEIGREAVQFNEEEPISKLVNTYTSLVSRLNYAKLYEKYYFKAYGSSEIFNGIRLRAGFEYADRNPLVNHSDYSFLNRDDTYTSNDPLRPDVYGENSFSSHQALTLSVNIRIRLGQKYLSYPNRKFITGSKYPDFIIQYRRGIPILGADTDFDFVSLAMKDNFRIGMLGNSSINLEGGTFITDNAVPFIDFHHFNGKQTDFYLTGNILDQFRMLSYYNYSTTNPYAKLQWEHNFGGAVLGKIPGVRKLQWNLLVGSNVLYMEEVGPYSEFLIGMDNIGYGLFRFLRVDFVTQFLEGQDKPAFRIQIGADF